MPTSDLELNGLLSDIRSRFDTLLSSADEVGRVYDQRLKEVTLELLAREKRMAAGGGEPYEAFGNTVGTLLGGGFAWWATGDKRRFDTSWSNLGKQRKARVQSVEKQEQAVEGASKDVMWRSMEEYLKERLNPARHLDYIRFIFFKSIVEWRDASGNLKTSSVTLTRSGQNPD